MKPVRYTATEGGKWLKFSDDFTWDINDFMLLNMRMPFGGFKVAIKGITLHSILLEDNGKCIIWDCMIGFDRATHTTRVEY